MKITRQNLVLLSYKLVPEYLELNLEDISRNISLDSKCKSLTETNVVLLKWTIEYFDKNSKEIAMSYTSSTEFTFETDNNEDDDLISIKEYLVDYFAEIYSFLKKYTPITPHKYKYDRLFSDENTSYTLFAEGIMETLKQSSVYL